MKELIKRKTELQSRIRNLDWDLKRNQIHFAQKMKLDEFKKELEEINQKIKNDSEGKKVQA